MIRNHNFYTSAMSFALTACCLFTACNKERSIKSGQTDKGRSSESENASNEKSMPTDLEQFENIEVEMISTEGFPSRKSETSVRNRHLVTIMSDLKTLNGGTGAFQMNSETSFQYALEWQGDTANLLMTSQETEVKQNGKVALFYSANRNGMRSKGGNGEVSETYESANEEIKTLLRETYNNPLDRITVDQNYNETDRKRLTDTAATQVLRNNGAIENTRFFHSPFYQDRQTWTCQKKLGAGNGALSEGVLTYHRLGTTVQDQVKVGVSGTLTANVQQGPITIHAITQVKGVQVFDVRLAEWVAGHLEMDIEMGPKDSGRVEVTGKMNVEMKMTSSEKIEPEGHQ